MTSPYDFYSDLLKINHPEVSKEALEKDVLFTKKLLNLSQYYTLYLKESDKSIDKIQINGKYFIDPHYDNYLFKHYMKNHFYIMEYIKGFSTISNLKITDFEIKDYILSKFYSCLNSYSVDLKENHHIKKMTDYEIISTLCVKERLTYYSFLSSNKLMEKQNIKNYLNKKYIELVLKSPRQPIIEVESKGIDQIIKVYSKNKL